MDNGHNKDEGLIGNEKIEEAVLALQSEPSQEMLAHTLTVIRRRIREGGEHTDESSDSKDCGRSSVVVCVYRL